MEQLKAMKESLMAQAQCQMGNLYQVDAKELGEVIDMIKDLEEAIYYCTIVEAMEQKDKEPKQNVYYYTTTPYYEKPYYDDYYRDMDRDYGRMYYSGSNSGNGGRGGNGNSSSGNYTYQGNGSYQRGTDGHTQWYSERPMPIEFRDTREGRSPMSRKMYMESKEMHKDKEVKLKDLEKYMSELTEDVIEVLDGASPEEKQLLRNKVSTLAAKIDQMNG